MKTYETLDSYTKHAKFILKSLAPKIGYGVCKNILNDDQKFGDIVSSVIKADEKFDGRGSIKGWRVQMVKWAVLGILSKRDKISYESIDNVDQEYMPNPLSVEISEELTEGKMLTSDEKDIIQKYFFMNNSIDEIISEMKIDRDTVYKTMRVAVGKIKKKYGNY